MCWSFKKDIFIVMRTFYASPSRIDSCFRIASTRVTFRDPRSKRGIRRPSSISTTRSRKKSLSPGRTRRDRKYSESSFSVGRGLSEERCRNCRVRWNEPRDRVFSWVASRLGVHSFRMRMEKWKISVVSGLPSSPTFGDVCAYKGFSSVRESVANYPSVTITVRVRSTGVIKSCKKCKHSILPAVRLRLRNFGYRENNRADFEFRASTTVISRSSALFRLCRV